MRLKEINFWSVEHKGFIFRFDYFLKNRLLTV